MTNISKKVYERSFVLNIDYDSDGITRITKQINDLIDEITSYKPLYSTRKKMEQDPNFAIEQMKKVAIWSIHKHLGDQDG